MRLDPVECSERTGTVTVARIFISHSNKNNAEALAIKTWLEDQGWKDSFLDLHPEDGLLPGQRWQEQLRHAAANCELVLFLITPDWAASKWCLAEFLTAKQMNKRVFAAIVAATPFDDLPVELTAEWQMVDLTSGERDYTVTVSPPPSNQDQEVAFSSLRLGQLKTGLEKTGLSANYFKWPPLDEPDRPPYRGLKPLEEADAGIFFGRDGQIVVALDELRGLSETASPRLMALLGASGAGKSSFLKAGLLPRLRRDDQRFEVLPVLRPGTAAISGRPSGLISVLELALNKSGNNLSREVIRQAIDAGACEVKHILALLVKRARADAPPPTLVLPIDQGEELFLGSGLAEAATFLELLNGLLVSDRLTARPDSDDPLSQTVNAVRSENVVKQLRLMAIVAIRSDSYERLQTAKPLESVSQRTFSLAPMPIGEFGKVIDGPAERVRSAERKLEIEESLKTQLLRDIQEGKGSDALPLLAFTLERLYTNFGGSGHLKFVDYKKTGRIGGAINAAVEEALDSADADPRIPRERDARLELLRRGLIPWLAGVDPESGAPRRRVARFSDIPTEARPLIDKLVDRHLLSVDQPSFRDPHSGETHFEEKTIEPTHEALLRQWSVLRGWLEEDFELLAAADGLQRASREWEPKLESSESKEFLVHAGARLATAEKLLNRSDYEKLFSRTDRDYIAACRAAENDRHATETAFARRTLHRTRSFAAVALVLALGASSAGYFAYQNQIIAKDEAEKAVFALETQSKLINAEANQRLRDNDPVTALLLSLEALPDKNSDDIVRTAWPLLDAVSQTAYYSEVDRREIDVRSSSNSASLSFGQIENEDALLSSNDYSGQYIPGYRDFYTSQFERPSGFSLEVGHGDKPIVFEGHKHLIHSLDISSDGKLVASASRDNSARLWDAETGDEIFSFSIERISPVDSLPCDASNRRIYPPVVFTASPQTTEGAGFVGVRACETRYDNKDALSVSFDKASTNVLVTFENGVSAIFSTKDGSKVSEFSEHDGRIFDGAFHPEGVFAITTGADKKIYIWNTKLPSNFVELSDHDDSVCAVEFSETGAYFVTGSLDQTAILWDFERREKIYSFREHSSAVCSVAITMSGDLVATGSEDGTITLWEVYSNEPIATLKGHQSGIKDLSFSKDGNILFSAALDGTVRKWRTNIGLDVRKISLDGSLSYTFPISRGKFDKSLDTALFFYPRDLIGIASLTKFIEEPYVELKSGNGRRFIGQNLFGFSSHSNNEITLVISGREKKIHYKADILNAFIDKNREKIIAFLEDFGLWMYSLKSENWIEIDRSASNPYILGTLFKRDQFFYSCGLSRVCLSDSSTFQKIDEIYFPHGIIASLKVSEDASRAAILAEGGGIFLWDLKNGELIAQADTRRFGQHGEIAINRSGSSVLFYNIGVKSEEENSYPKPFAVEFGFDEDQVIFEILSPNEPIIFADFLESGKSFVAITSSGTVLYYDREANIDEKIEQLQSKAPRCLTINERRQFQLPEIPPYWCFSLNKWPFKLENLQKQAVEAFRNDNFDSLLIVLPLALDHSKELDEGFRHVASAVFAKASMKELRKGHIKNSVNLLDRAESTLQQKSAPNWVRGVILSSRGQISLAKNELKEAIQYFEEAERLEFEDLEMLFAQARVYEKVGDYEEAMDYYRQSANYSGSGDQRSKVIRKISSEKIHALSKK